MAQPFELGGIKDPDVRRAFEQISQSRAKGQVLGGQVSSAGAVTAGQGFTATRTGTGAYTVTITRADFSLIAPDATPIGTSTALNVNTITATSFKVTAAADVAFSFVAFSA